MRSDYGAVAYDEVFRQGLADSLHDTTLDLSLMRERVDYRSDVMRRDQAAKLDLASFRINLDLGDLRGKTCDIHRRFEIVDTGSSDRNFAALRRPSQERRQVDATTVCRDKAALTQLYLHLVARKSMRR
jgi:hypothetical protein